MKKTKPTNIETNLDADQVLDMRGFHCPMPLLKAKQKLNQMQPGEILCVLCTDPVAEQDFTLFCHQSPHELLKFFNQDSYFIALLRCDNAGDISQC